MNQETLLVDAIIKGLQEKKGHDIVTVDLRELHGAICRYMVVCQGNNPNQVSALADSVWETVNNALREKPITVEGQQNAQWVGMDYGNVLVHIFLPEMRAFYRLEDLWEDNNITHLPNIL
ncbi:MAG: ribosome silencing factor [Tannerella sp.]|jgi:ribosome-associated protein|nr:ribosome silencing factor [Tannerella sp.]